MTLAADLFRGYHAKPIQWSPPDTEFVACNPSIFFDGTTWRCVLRCINYRLGQDAPAETHSLNVMTILDPRQDWKVIDWHPIVDRSKRDRTNYPIHGYEDCWLFRFEGTLWMTATCCDLTPEGNREMCLLKLGSGYSITECFPMRGPWSKHFQKNWIPCVDERELTFVYSVEQPLVIQSNSSGRDEVDWNVVNRLRGSSQGIQLDDGWLYLTHDADYRSRFVRTDKMFRMKHLSPLFNFKKPLETEFSAGMTLDGDQLVVSYSVRDSSTELGFFSLQDVLFKMQNHP